MHIFEEYLQRFMNYLTVEKNASTNTIHFYSKDVEMFITFLKKEHIDQAKDVNQQTIRLFLTELYNRHLSRLSVSLTISCLRTFYKYLEKENVIYHNPFIHIHLPKQTKLIPSFFYEEELEILFQINDTTTPIGQRNQAL